MHLWMIYDYLARCERFGIKPTLEGAARYKKSPLIKEFLTLCNKYGWPPTEANYSGYIKTRALRQLWQRQKSA